MADMQGRVSRYLQAGWRSHNWLSRSLLPLSSLYSLISSVRRRRLQARAARLPRPLAVVGNIYLGGAGKTPFVIWLVRQWQAQGVRVGVISRGYGRRGDEVREVHADSRPEDCGDEPLLLKRALACPLFVARQRYQAGLALLAAYPEVEILIADDGLQHYALARDVEIVLCDTRGVGNGALLPAGPLREGPERARDFTVFNAGVSGQAAPADAPQPCFTMRLQAGLCWRLQAPQETAGLDALRQRHAGAPVLAAAGIGEPARFFALLAQHGLPAATLALPDHYDFAQNPFAASDAQLILITEKDAVKCATHASMREDGRIWVVPVIPHCDPLLAQLILEKCRGCSPA
ncbi:tetraacyldisaccharide 4'-kinase [Massilia sp. W12]|uniref:tetraacyldisaccharide 4'-kinase n=1 Tax=Massilia sp. W12 TaxID=3126507 RepID=UPI0030CF3B0C